MNISVWGLGYVGIATMIGLEELGHTVMGTDVKGWKVDNINKGYPTVGEPGLDDKLFEAVKKGKILATHDPKEALLNSDLSLICVGTPSTSVGDIDLAYIRHVSRDIGRALRYKKDYHIVIVRSTVFPGTTEQVVIPILKEESDKKAGSDFGVCVNPEFLREGSLLVDFLNPGIIVIGQMDDRAGSNVARMYESISSEIVRVDIRTAEIVKYTNNAFHATKISFANEMGNICQEMGVDSREVMRILCSDTKLNISPNYLKPGFAFGGSCLGKDLRALIARSVAKGYSPDLLESVLKTNEGQIVKAYRLAENMMDGKVSGKRVVVLGVAFKKNSDDVRESRIIDLIKNFIKNNAYICVLDPLAIPETKKILCNKVLYPETLDDAFKDSDLCILGLNYQEFDLVAEKINLMRNPNILDLCNHPIQNTLKSLKNPSVIYKGIVW